MSPRKKSTFPWKWLAVAAASLAFVFVLSCNSPFIPIPPPNPSFSQDSSSGDWSVSTPADERAVGATYFVLNAGLGSGIIQRASADGSMYATHLQGQTCDSIFIHWEKPGNEQSSTICRPLGEGLSQMGCQ